MVTPPVGLTTVLQRIETQREVQSSVMSVRSPVRIDLRDAEGKTTRLEGALAVRSTGDVRLKVWRSGRDVMDLTRQDGHAFAWVDDRVLDRADRSETGVELAKTSADSLDTRLSDWLSALTWFIRTDQYHGLQFLSSVQLDPIDGRPFVQREVIFAEPVDGVRYGFNTQQGWLESRESVVDPRWRADFSYSSSLPYRRIGMTLAVEQTKVTVTLSEPSWNEPLADALFVPPKKARPLSGDAPP
ncbi:MAG: hypothetical protein AAF916_05565 [Planctomycetota bacterium]